MKKRKIILFILLGLFTLTACTTKQSTDDQFFSDFASMWQERSKLIAAETENSTSESDTSEKSNSSTIQTIQKAYQLEYDKMKKYDSETFSDEKLGENVKKYLESLKAMIDALSQESSIESTKAFNAAYKARLNALDTIAEDKRFVIPKEQLNELNIDENAVALQEKKQKAAQTFQETLSKLSPEITHQPTTSAPYVEMTAKLTNNTDMRITGLSITFNFVDSNGNVLDSNTFTADTMAPGDTKTITLHTEKLNYDHIDIKLGDKLDFEE